MRTTILFITLFLCGSALSMAQEGKTLPSHKRSPVLAAHKAIPGQPQTYWIVTTDSRLFKTFLASRHLSGIIRHEYPATNLLVVHTTPALVDSLLLPSPLVTFADLQRTPREELVLNNHDNSTNQLNTVHASYPSLHGGGLTVSIKEHKPDTTDIDLKGRYLPTPLSSPTITQHAGIMATLIGGGGNSDASAKGAAWAARLSASHFATLLPDADSHYQQYQVSVQNHAYGTGIENYYGADAAAYDASSLANPTLLHVFSAGNAGQQTGTQGTYAGLPGIANLTGSFKMGKNLLTAGAINHLYQVEAASSRGPAYDGRLKPDLVAFGEEGSSGAAAITAGTALLIQQALQQQTGQLPPAVLVKAILLNTADDVASPGIDYQSGYGSVNAFKAIRATQAGTYALGDIAGGQTITTPLTIPAGISLVKATLSWFDAPAAPNAPQALLHDLDLELVNTATGQTWHPWVLSHFPHIDSLTKPPVRKRDALNNNEQVTLELPAPGNYLLRVTGTRVPATRQAYAMAWQLDTANRFQWYFPAKADNCIGNEANTLRWAASFAGNQPGKLEYSTDGGQQWTLIADQVNLAQGYYSWQAPALYTTALLRMTAHNQSFRSDTFTISTPLKATTGFNCSDSFLLTWNKPAGVNGFVVYALDAQYLAPVRTIADTTIVLGKTAHPAFYYTVAPLLANGYTGARAYTFHYAHQGVGCYIRTFLADLVNNTAQLQIALGTGYGIQQMTIEKLGANGYQPWQVINPVNSLTWKLTDKSLHRGLNTYRLKILQQHGAVTYSQPETVTYFGDAPYLVFPNPLPAGSVLKVLSAVPGPATFFLFNAAGQQVLQKPLTALAAQVPLHTLQRGLYFYVIRKEGKKEQTGSLLIY